MMTEDKKISLYQAFDSTVTREGDENIKGVGNGF